MGIAHLIGFGHKQLNFIFSRTYANNSLIPGFWPGSNGSNQDFS